MEWIVDVARMLVVGGLIVYSEAIMLKSFSVVMYIERLCKANFNNVVTQTELKTV